MPDIKICCIKNLDEAKMAIGYGASWIGLVSDMPTSPGVISEDTVAEIAAVLPRPFQSVLLTCQTDAEAIIAQHRRTGVNAIQLVDRVGVKVRRELNRALPDIKLIPVVHVTGEEAIEEACEAQKHADILLLDSGNPDAVNKVFGGTGKTHDWSISRKIVEMVNVPVFLAGGLTPENVSEAIEVVKPQGVDVCSGVRTDGLLDERKLGKFVRATRKECQKKRQTIQQFVIKRVENSDR